MASSSSSSSKRYDVFISFRGEDTRLSFTAHLHKALCDKNITTYIDYELRKGDEIWPKLCAAIEDSHIALVIFSEDYASSKWCLKELVKIMECRKDRRQVVIPIFYKTDPSDIRKLTGNFGKGFAKYERDLSDNQSDKDTVLGWKHALREAANMAGWHSESPGNRDEPEFIQKIVDDVHSKLSRLLSPNEMKGLVGMEKDCKRVELLLEKGRTIGIWSMGGLGKTTLAKALFAKLFPQYDAVCFLENVREESTMRGLSYSANKLLFELLKSNVTTSDVIGSPIFKQRLKRSKALVVLDDVDCIPQLEYLYNICGEVGRDSRLIITTRDRQLLAGKADQIYELKKRNFPESLAIFSSSAFNESSPKEGYEALSEKAVRYAGGVPLALKILGLHLHSKDEKFWECELRKLENYPVWDIMNVLMLSYNGLDKPQKAIFLDIAFFFKDIYKDYVISILDACDFYATSGIDVLEDKALISSSYCNTIEMHDLIQEMGLQIVRQECLANAGERSRLRDIKEVSDVLENNYGTPKVEGIKLDLSQIEHLRLTYNSFKVMPKLRYLNFYVPLGKRSGNVHLPYVLNPFSNELRYIQWNGYRSKYLPRGFCANFLVEFRMPYSNLKKLWEGVQDLKYLEGIDLSECKHLKELPDLCKALRLKWVYLSGCESLCHLHPSLLSLDSLVTLILDGCIKLESLESGKHLSSLQKLSVRGCLNLKKFAVSSDKIEKLDFSMTGVEMLHSSIGRLSKLKWLNLEGSRLRDIPDELSSLESMEELKISNCEVIINKEKPQIQFDRLRFLQVLHLRDCGNLSQLPDNISFLSKLHELRLDGSSMESLPAGIKHLHRLEILFLENCGKLESLPELPRSIKELCVDNCTSLVTVSTLKTFALEMKGKNKYFSFKNSLKLDARSVNCIMDDGHLTMMSALFHNVQVRRYGLYEHSYNYNSARFCFPGSRTPRQVPHRTTESVLDVPLPAKPNLLGFILYVVLSPSLADKKHGIQIECHCYLADGTMVGHFGTKWYHEPAASLNTDHVFVWYDPFFCDSILKSYERPVSFKFTVTPYNVERDHRELILTKECGVCLIHASQFGSFLEELDLELDKKVDVGVMLGLALDMEQRLPTQVERELFYALPLEDGSELEADVRSEYESRRRAIEEEIAKLNEMQCSSNPVLAHEALSDKLRKDEDAQDHEKSRGVEEDIQARDEDEDLASPSSPPTVTYPQSQVQLDALPNTLFVPLQLQIPLLPLTSTSLHHDSSCSDITIRGGSVNLDMPLPACTVESSAPSDIVVAAAKAAEKELDTPEVVLETPEAAVVEKSIYDNATSSHVEPLLVLPSPGLRSNPARETSSKTTSSTTQGNFEDDVDEISLICKKTTHTSNSQGANSMSQSTEALSTRRPTLRSVNTCYTFPSKSATANPSPSRPPPPELNSHQVEKKVTVGVEDIPAYQSIATEHQEMDFDLVADQENISNSLVVGNTPTTKVPSQQDFVKRTTIVDPISVNIPPVSEVRSFGIDSSLSDIFAELDKMLSSSAGHTKPNTQGLNHATLLDNLGNLLSYSIEDLAMDDKLREQAFSLLDQINVVKLQLPNYAQLAVDQVGNFFNKLFADYQQICQTIQIHDHLLASKVNLSKTVESAKTFQTQLAEKINEGNTQLAEFDVEIADIENKLKELKRKRQDVSNILSQCKHKETDLKNHALGWTRESQKVIEDLRTSEVNHQMALLAKENFDSDRLKLKQTLATLKF